MEFHPIADTFPLMTRDEYAGLRDDIEQNGLLEPIWLYESKIIDGRNRYQACVELGITPTYRKWEGTGSPLAFSVSLNLHRRHLSESQRAMIAARLATQSEGRPTKTASIEAVSQTEAAQMLNVSRASVQRAHEVLERGSPALIASVDSGSVAVSDAVRQLRREEDRARLSKPSLVLPDAYTGPFDLILADPPWRYDFSADSADDIEQHYPTQTLAEIAAEPPHAAPNSVLFLWATAPKLQEAMEVMKAWGFAYKTHAVWDKLKIGTGYWFRGQHELLLVGTRGQFSPPSEVSRRPSVFTEARTAHSKKPVCVYEWLDSAFPQARKLEMYARVPRSGWASWGNEIQTADLVRG